MIPRNVVLTAVLVALLSLPYAAALLSRFDSVTLRRAWIRRSRADRPALRRLESAMRGESASHGSVPLLSACPESVLPSIDQAAAELRRLNRQRLTGPAGGSELWLAAVGLAYDDWLQVACRRLAIAQRLDALDDIDRDLERLRMEMELAAAGVEVRPGTARPGSVFA